MPGRRIGTDLEYRGGEYSRSLKQLLNYPLFDCGTTEEDFSIVDSQTFLGLFVPEHSILHPMNGLLACVETCRC